MDAACGEFQWHEKELPSLHPGIVFGLLGYMCSTFDRGGTSRNVGGATNDANPQTDSQMIETS